MAMDLLAEAGKIVGSAFAGGLITAASAFPYYNSKLSKLTVEVSNMKESCITCRTDLGNDVATLRQQVTEHREDDDKHYTKASDKLLNDILTRVMRIENRLFNGHSQQSD